MKQTLAGLFLALGMAGACADQQIVGTITNVDFWVEDLKFSLSGVTSGVFSTNGIIARTHAVPVRITSHEIINSLNNQPAALMGWGSNYAVISVTVTNFPVSGTMMTNYALTIFPTNNGPVVTASYSPQAKLVLLEPLGPAAQLAAQVFVAVRDGNPATNYIVDSYFTLTNIRPSTPPESDPFNPVTGKLDVYHGLVSLTRYADAAYAFSSPAGSAASLSFQVGGYTTEHIASIIVHQTNVVERAAVTALNASVSGTGTLGAGGAPCVLRGTVATAGGKLERQ